MLARKCSVAVTIAALGLLIFANCLWSQDRRTSPGMARPAHSAPAPFRFHLEEATIDDIHRAIREGQITCQGLVRLYLNRAKAYNGVADELVTRDGAPISPPNGVLRAGELLKYPTNTIAISTLLPNFESRSPRHGLGWNRYGAEMEPTRGSQPPI